MNRIIDEQGATRDDPGSSGHGGKPVNLKDIARMTSLDVSTVSRALRGDSRRVAPATIARVQQLAEELGYIPNTAAASLRGGKSRLFGVLVPSFSDVVIGLLVEAIEAELIRSGYLPLVIATQDDTELRSRAIRVLLGRRVDGLILADSNVGHEVPDELDVDRVPVVFAIRGVDEALSVRADDHLGGQLVAEHFIANGHRNLALLHGAPRARTAHDRAEGFLAAANEAGLDVTSIDSRAFGVEAGYHATQELLSRGKDFSAVFCVNDYNAVGCARALTERGMKLADDVALAGYNDIPLAHLLETPLTSVRTHIGTMGSRAAQLLVDVVEGRSPRSQLLEPTLMVRDSSQPSR